VRQLEERQLMANKDFQLTPH